jgi:hypothetical protein
MSLLFLRFVNRKRCHAYIKMGVLRCVGGKRYLTGLFLPSVGFSFRGMCESSEEDALWALMNGKIRRKLKIIPANVMWGGNATLCAKHI